MSRAVPTRICVGITLIAHVLALLLSGADAASTPISQLSRADAGWLHTTGLLTLALAWILLMPDLWPASRRILWRSGCAFFALSVPVLVYVAYYFASASDMQLFGPDANDPLAILASTLGVAMGAFQPELKRRAVNFGRVNLSVLILWIALVPVIPFIEPGWLGAYERCVGSLMLIWTLLMSYVVQQVHATSP